MRAYTRMEDRGFDLDARLDALEDDDRRRRLSPADRVAERGYFAAPPGGDLPVLDADELLVFASDNYLGLTADERVQNAARRAAATVGTGAGASRLATGDTMVHHDLERLLAETTGTDRALSFSSGYAATVGTIAALAPDVVFVDELTRERVADGCRLAGADAVAYDHCDATDLQAKLAARDERPGSDAESWLVVTDSTFAVDGSVASLAAVCGAAEAFGAWVLVDESHATGLYARGGGVVRAEGLEDHVHVQVGTLSTALASQGGYVAGANDLIACLINDAQPFANSAGLAPPAAAAASEALHVSRHGDVRERLWDNVAHLRDGLEALGYDVLGDTQLLLLDVGDARDARALAAAVRDRGVVAPAICPPDVPEGAARLRVTPMATHSEDDVIDCLEAFQAASEAVGLP